MNIDKPESFLFDGSFTDNQLLKSYVESIVKYNTLAWYLYYEDYFVEHTETSLLNLETPMKATSIDESSSDNDIDQYFIYLKACHMGTEYIEHALKLLLMLDGYTPKELRKLGIEHDLKKHFDLLKNAETKNGICGSIGHYPVEYLENVIQGIPTNFNFVPWSKETQAAFDRDLDIIEKENRTREEAERYSEIKKRIKEYNEHKYDEPAKQSKNYFDPILKILSSGFVDLRYPEISKKCNYYNLDIILSICKNINFILREKFERVTIIDMELANHNSYLEKIQSTEEEKLNQEVDNSLPSIDRPLTDFEQRKLVSSNKSKYTELFYYLYGMEEFHLTGKSNYWSSIGDLIHTSSITRERVTKKSSDKEIYDNCLYYQGCHIASEYIEHGLKMLLLKSGYTYETIKNVFGHDFKKMVLALSDKIKDDLSSSITYFNELYLDKASTQSSGFRDTIKETEEEKQFGLKLKRILDLVEKRDCYKLELSQEEQKYIDSFLANSTDNQEYSLKVQNLKKLYFEKILTQVSDSFKYTRYPDFYNYNMDYKYCLKYLLAFAETIEREVERTYNFSYFRSNKDSKSEISKLIDELRGDNFDPNLIANKNSTLKH